MRMIHWIRLDPGLKVPGEKLPRAKVILPIRISPLSAALNGRGSGRTIIKRVRAHIASIPSHFHDMLTTRSRATAAGNDQRRHQRVGQDCTRMRKEQRLNTCPNCPVHRQATRRRCTEHRQMDLREARHRASHQRPQRQAPSRVG